MRHVKIISIALLLISLSLTACNKNESTPLSSDEITTATSSDEIITLTSSDELNTEDTASKAADGIQTISGEEAKKLMDNLDSFILLDVRTEEEYNEGHIPGAILIPDSSIEENAETLLPDKDATIFVYCRSGRRSAIAAKTLSSMGYTSIYDFGGIIDWNYDIIKE